MIKIKNYAEARQALENLIALSEKLGTRPLLARGHLLKATVLRLSGNAADAASEYRQAVEIVHNMQKDAGPKFVERSDVKSLLAEAARWTPRS